MIIEEVELNRGLKKKKRVAFIKMKSKERGSY